MIELSDSQIEELVRMIKEASTKSDLAKKVIIWLLLKSQSGTKKVAVSIYPKKLSEVEEMVKLAKEVWDGIHDCNRDNDEFSLFLKENSLMRFSQSGGIYVIDKDFKFFAHEGSIIKDDVRVAILPETYTATIWIAPEMYDHSSDVLDLNMEEVNAIEL